MFKYFFDNFLQTGQQEVVATVDGKFVSLNFNFVM